MNHEPLTCAIIGHLVGDYLLQNDWMACNKKAAKLPPGYCDPWCYICFFNLPCFVHCWLWTLAVCFFAGWWNPLAVGVLFLTHYIQDRTYLINRWMMLRWKDQRRFMACDDFDLTDMRVVPGLGPWSVIVVDNVWHLVTIWAVWKWIA